MAELEVTVRNRVATVRLCREHRRNALSEALRDALEQQFLACADDDAVAVVILTGGEQVFSAGFDLDEVAASGFATFDHRVEEFNRAVHGFPKPLVTAVSGPALAGGFDLALAGDIILAAETAVFGHPEVRFGAPPSIAKLWPRVGLSRAKELALTGRTVDAEEALTLGLVDRIVPAASLLATAADAAADLASAPARTLQIVKQLTDDVARQAQLEALTAEAHATSAALATPEARDRLEAYLTRLRPG